MFISLEGPDYSGKTTMSEVMKQYFVSRGKQVIVTREPGGTQLGNGIRNILLQEDLQKDPIDVPTQILLFYSARIHHINKVIIPALKCGKVVISDRFMDSSLVYQGKVYGYSDFINTLVNIPQIKYLTVRPDYTFYYDLDYETMIDRMNSREDFNSLDIKYSKLKELPLECYKQHFYELQKELGDKIQIIDANSSIETVETATLAACGHVYREYNKQIETYPIIERQNYLQSVLK